ncbi:MAG: IS1595 family transposase [Tepidisphaeraceae bacterium]
MNTTNSNNGHHPKTLLAAIRYFSDQQLAHDFFVSMRWPNDPICPRCGSTEVAYQPKYRRFQCKHSHDGRQFTVKTGSVMEDSPLGLDKWALALWMEVNSKNSISSYEVHRAAGITQKSAWFLLHRLRFAVKRKSFEKMGRNGVPVEADETYLGGLAHNMHKDRRQRIITGRGQTGKTVVMGLLERHTSKKNSTVRTMVLPKHPSQADMQAIIHKHVEPGAHLMTDEHAAYQPLYSDFEHQFIDHANRYAEGIVHTNGLENFWSLFKRCIKGTHVSIEPFHTAAYLDSEAFRFNNREVKDGDRFVMAAKGLHGKRLTYKALVGASELSPGNDKGEGSAGLPN